MSRLRRVLDLVFGRRPRDRGADAHAKRLAAIESDAIEAQRAAVRALAERQRVIDATRGAVHAIQRTQKRV